LITNPSRRSIFSSMNPTMRSPMNLAITTKSSAYRTSRAFAHVAGPVYEKNERSNQ
jgi:hypothetical protein